ncbi:ClpX C4-type zinc finger protein [Priestia aryabhattai]|uniref:ClpX C4-type zinc finger protein n=1 Tax=Priestia aryabhattai TaxID=412384 RepID=UPI001ADA8F34|nr:ClpX C4-type zinc finger protein [Priestia aryabhattai]QTL52393.1 ClpX C4-type zinc finger protein [Priestia aryabhattai]
MDNDFRKKTFRGAKIEDTIIEFEKLIKLCEERTVAGDQLEKQRFYEGMTIAYKTASMKLKGEFDYIEQKVIDEIYNAVSKTTGKSTDIKTDHVENCSFCRRGKSEVGNLIMGPGVSICYECLQFGEEVFSAQKND